MTEQTKETKPRYELRRRSKGYVGLWEGKHCLAGICTKKPRGLLDAQLLLRVCNAFPAMEKACEALIEAVCYDCAEFSDNACSGCQYLDAITLSKAALAAATE